MGYQPVVTKQEGDTLDANQKGQYILAARRDSDTAPVSDGQVMGLITDDEGRLKTSNKTANYPVTTGAVNTVNAVMTIDVRRASNMVLHVKNTGTVAMAAGQFVFEASLDSTNGTDGTWFSIQAIRSNANTIETNTGTLAIGIGAGLGYSWEASVNAYQYARVRCTVAVTAGASATWIAQRGSYATEPIPGAQASATQSVSGSVTAVPTSATALSVVTAATTNAASVKTSAANLYELTIANVTATPAYLKFYNKASAPTVGTDVPMITFPIAANTTVVYEFGVVGKRFSTGLAYAVTGAASATDTTATVAGIQVNGTYL